MESRRNRMRKVWIKWSLYVLLLLVGTVLQTTPNLLQFGFVKPVFVLSICIAVAAHEGEFAGALFGLFTGLTWDYTAGRIVGMLGFSLMLLCFLISLMVQLYLQYTPRNYVLIIAVAHAVVLGTDFLFFYSMPGYTAPMQRLLTVVLPTIVLSAICTMPVYYMVSKIAAITEESGS